MWCYWKSGFSKKISKWPVTPTFFSKNVFSWDRSSERVKTIRMLMFKIPEFSLAPRLCRKAGLDLVSARKDFDPRTLVSGDLRHFDTTVRCAAHYARATLNSISRAGLNFRRRPVLCTTLYRNLTQASNFGNTFPLTMTTDPAEPSR